MKNTKFIVAVSIELVLVILIGCYIALSLRYLFSHLIGIDAATLDYIDGEGLRTVYVMDFLLSLILTTVASISFRKTLGKYKIPVYLLVFFLWGLYIVNFVMARALESNIH